VYLNVTPRQMDLSEVALIYPGLLETLLEHPGIGWVVGREGDEVAIASKEGSLWLGVASQRVEGTSPLTGLIDPAWAAAQLRRLAQFPHAGDLILLGAWDGDQVICFEEQVASHGGLGGPQDWPFIAFAGLPGHERLRAQGIHHAEEIYARLIRLYGQYG
jgi:hypothetical protein